MCDPHGNSNINIWPSKAFRLDIAELVNFRCTNYSTGKSYSQLKVWFTKAVRIELVKSIILKPIFLSPLSFKT